MLLDGNNTICVLGLITSQTNRDNPPQPYNGFDTAYTPFGNGHIFAFQMGGTDDTRNLVPQWQQWQQTGEWRKCEEICHNDYQGRIFRCDIEYDSSLGLGRDNVLEEFGANPFVSWKGQDSRLPTKFRIRVYNANIEIAGIKTDQDFVKVRQTLNGEKSLYDSGELKHQDMPDEDHVYYQNQAISTSAQVLYENFNQAEKQRVENDGDVFKEVLPFSSFLFHEDTKNEMQTMLKGNQGFNQTDIAGLQVDRIVKQSLHGKTSEGAIKKSKFKFIKDYDIESGLKKRREGTLSRQKNEREKRMAARRK